MLLQNDDLSNLLVKIISHVFRNFLGQGRFERGGG